jgi:glutaryl-CoA dehydrogenase
MHEDIGRSLSTDYFRIADQLSTEELGYLLRTRAFVDDEVLPVINGYWERAEFPWPLVEKLAKLGIVGDGIDGYGCPPMSPIATGLVHMELNRGDGSLASSSASRPAWPCSRSPCSGGQRRRSAGCPAWPG